MNNEDRSTKNIAKFEVPRAANDTQLQEDFDDLVERAADGDSRAVGAIAIALGPSLLEEARAAMKGLDGADDVVQDFFVFLLERRSPFIRAYGPAREWLHTMVRIIARRRRREQMLDDDED
jgi:DNA-directed RNA polymerase specialized sigma24 family protein